MNTAWVIARHTFRECIRRRVFLIVPVVTVGFLGLFALGTYYAFDSTGGQIRNGPVFVDSNELVGSTLVGLAMFVTLFLGSVLGIFLTFSAVRGDAEVGVLQQLVVRPVARSGVLLGRFLGACAICVTYVLILYTGAALIVGTIGDWWPEPFLAPGLHLILGVMLMIALTLLGSVFLTALPNGIVMFMVYGGGLLAGLLGQLGEAINSPALETTGRITAWALPFEAVYQSGLDSLTSRARGLTRVVVELGPLGGAQDGGPFLVAYALAYLVLAAGIAVWAFSRRDL